MAAVTSCENTPYIPVHEPVTGLICYIRATGTLTLYHYYITSTTIVRPAYTFTFNLKKSIIKVT